ncbi:MAG: hypothetical protein V4611_02200 [Patescibacteria group bacterium]
MATDDQNNYWEQNPEDQPAELNQPEINNEEYTPQNPEQTPVEAPVAQDTPDNPPITWTAQEYVHMDRSPIWFILFALIVLALVAVDVLFLKSWTFSALVIVMAIAIVIYIRRPPRTLTYALSPVQGLYVGERLYHFDEFKAFGLIRDGEHNSIMLIPRKRFAPGVSVYFPEDAGERIVDILGQRLPMEELKLDVVDIVVRKLRL